MWGRQYGKISKNRSVISNNKRPFYPKLPFCHFLHIYDGEIATKIRLEGARRMRLWININLGGVSMEILAKKQGRQYGETPKIGAFAPSPGGIQYMGVAPPGVSSKNLLNDRNHGTCACIICLLNWECSDVWTHVSLASQA